MPIKLIGAILLAVLVAVLTGFNLSNKCSVWFFHNFLNVPVFALVIGAFVAGVLVALPFTFGKSGLKKQLEKAKKDLSAKNKQLDDTRIEYEAKLRNAMGKDSSTEPKAEETKTIEEKPVGKTKSKRIKK